MPLEWGPEPGGPAGDLLHTADAAEAFGLGRDEGPIRPEGATEVRQAAAEERRTHFLQPRPLRPPQRDLQRVHAGRGRYPQRAVAGCVREGGWVDGRVVFGG